MSTTPTPEPNETELALPPSRSKAKSVFSSPTKQDRIRWHLFREKRQSFEEIAEVQGVAISTVEASVDRVEAYRALTSNAEISAELNSMVMDLAPDAKTALKGALKAEHVIRKTNEEGCSEVISRSPDDKTRLAAFSVFQKLADRQLPKGGGVNIAVQQNAGGQAPVNDGVKHLSFEELLRQRRALKGMTNDENVEDAEYENIDESAEEDEDGDEES